MKNNGLVNGLVGTAALLGILYFFPWKNITWGRVTMVPERVVTVTGYAESKERNQIAKFSVGVNSVKDEKTVAVKEVNDKITTITNSVKEFGIEVADVQTQSMSVYQRQDSVYEGGVQKSKPGQWEVSNTIEVTLREVDKANNLADLLTKSGATNVYGPNFQLDTSKKSEDALVAAAVADARVKAEVMAKAAGATLDKVVSLNESGSAGSVYPMYAVSMDAKGGGGSSLEAGSTKVTKTVSVVWSIK